MTAIDEFIQNVASITGGRPEHKHVRAMAFVLQTGYCVHLPGPYDATNEHYRTHVKRLHNTLMARAGENRN